MMHPSPSPDCLMPAKSGGGMAYIKHDKLSTSGQTGHKLETRGLQTFRLQFRFQQSSGVHN